MTFKLYQQPTTILICSVLVATVGVACSNINSLLPSSHSQETVTSPSPTTQPSPSSLPSPSPTTPSAQEIQKNYERALDIAEGAKAIASSAQSPEDWQLVANRWQSAINLLETVDKSHQSHKDAQTKLTEYKNSLSNATAKAKLPPQVQAQKPRTSSISSEDSASINDEEIASSKGEEKEKTQDNREVYTATINRRLDGNPVISVTLNGSTTTEMSVSPGAGGTVITQLAATNLGIVPDIDNNAAKVKSISVGGAVINNVSVTVSPSAEVGVLGRELFRKYDVEIKDDDNVVEFRRKR